ncbi:protein of unknown function [Rhodovastum atsumiense]|uniref:hypothetical protein n=1 Tax=Rhodovastum atsumiense TaxID=504468 RepID=UPI00139F2A4F|nr:hypothetical protein [Rhodovastum atsumiense]CAH2602666.1 protein of unknown function [Rhodovastum atsumiense]
MISSSISDLSRRALLVAACCIAWPGPCIAVEDSAYVPVEFARFIAEQRAPEGRVIPLRPDRVRFEATVMSQPRTARTDYLMEVLRFLQVEPMPEVSRQMFLRADNGVVHAVYVGDPAAAMIRERFANGSRATFFGLRVYSYGKGPAILLEAVGPAP